MRFGLAVVAEVGDVSSLTFKFRSLDSNGTSLARFDETLALVMDKGATSCGVL